MIATVTRPGAGRLVGVGRSSLHINRRPRELTVSPSKITHPLARGRYQSPLRYPGAKSGLAQVVGSLISAAKTSRQVRHVELLVEPFAGGASTSLRLVGSEIVDRILLADADPLVATFWQVAASDTEALIDRMASEHACYVARGGATALERWDFWRAWTAPAGMKRSTARFESAMKCLFLNRTTFSGILHGQAGPIGGRKQESEYGIGCRYNVNALAERLRYIGHLYATGRLIDVWCKDWKQTLADVPESYPQLDLNNIVAYLDPPYLDKSHKLYQRSFNRPSPDLDWSDRLAHYRLAEHLRRRMRFRWVLSYDAHPLLLSEPALYAADRMTPSDEEKEVLGAKSWRISKRLVTLSYTASARNGRGAVDEVLLTTLPPTTVPANDVIRLVT